MTTLRGWTRPRPIRVAFLVEDGEHAALMLDGVFADCYARWGGRFSLIVPCVDHRIPAAYWPWLESYDPDLIYSYVTLTEADILEIHERLNPAEMYFYRPRQEPRLDVFGFKPDWKFSMLSSLSAAFRIARHRRGADLPLRVLDSWHTETSSRFLTDNFGTYHDSHATGMYPADATAAVDRLVIVNPDKAADRKFGVPQDLAMLPNELEAMRAIAENRATSLALLSAQFAPKLDIRFGHWSGTFNLVVGDSYADRLLFWNARLLIPGWLDPDLCCLRITAEQLDDADFLAVLATLLNRHNHVNGGAGGQAQLRLRSCSLDAAQLEALALKLRGAKIWSAISAEAVASPDAVIPDAPALQHAREGNGSAGSFSQTPGWTSFTWTPPVARPPAEAPDHLADAPVRQSFTLGHWASDFMLELDGPGTWQGENRWRLPRRWRMARAFDVQRASDQQHALPPPQRTSRDGRLTAFVASAHPVATIGVPTPREAVQYALAADGRHAQAMRDQGEIIPPAKAIWLRPGNENRYLTGVLGMAGGLDAARQFLLHPFLRQEFAKLGGAPDPTGADIQRTEARLQKQVGRQTPYDLRDAPDRAALSNLIVRAARDLKHPKTFSSYATLKKDWTAYCAAYWAAHPQPQGAGEDAAEWEQREEDSLDHCLVALRQRQMLFQGHRWICRRCSHHNWQDFSELSAELTCAVCQQVRPAPIAIEWLFRPNEFLIACLRDYSTLSLIWLLHTLAQRTRASFFYVGPTEFGFTPGSETLDAEGDLLVVVDGRALLCEVKSSWRDVRVAELDKLAELALRLRPDVAVLAVMEAGDGPAAKIAEIRARLAEANIALEVIIPRADNGEDGPYLPGDA
jgi:hypothetical protein